MLDSDFNSAINSFGASALLFRTIQLCRDCPQSFRGQLNDFRKNWQWIELERIRKGGKHLTLRAAYTIYIFCCLLDPPDELPFDKGGVIEGLAGGDLCSPWTAVLPLDAVGAFELYTEEAR